MDKLLTRDEFREAVFKRDGYKCVFCGEPAVDAHHILERRLWPDGGYYISNGASVCGQHHLECEMTTISVEEVREACGITRYVLPPHLYRDLRYDKWGNVIQENGTRLCGELFWDSSVQKILREGKVLDQFVHYMKYPRTYHLPWSEGLHNDDRMMQDTNFFEGRRVVVTEKLDGENTTMYCDHIHARSIDSGGGHSSRDWVKNFWASISHDIPYGWRICGENMYAEHSIHYYNLESYFYGFSIWDHATCLSWDETLEWFNLFGILPVPVLYDGIYNEQAIKNLWKQMNRDRCEGYVVRVADRFEIGDFRTHVGKFVRRDHIQTTKHWFRGQPIVPNDLR